MTQLDLLDSVVFPYSFVFRIGTLHNDFIAKDATGQTKAYAKQKLFKLKEKVTIYTDEKQSDILYTIEANKWLDFNTSYQFLKPDGNSIGRLGRKGWKSLWKASYELFDENDQQDLVITEKNAWIKVFDALLSEIPVLGMLTGYLFNPSYLIKRPDGTLVCTFSKQASFFGRKFLLHLDDKFETGEEERVKLGVMMMALLERRRG